jgi:hypothetical protein
VSDGFNISRSGSWRVDNGLMDDAAAGGTSFAAWGNALRR